MRICNETCTRRRAHIQILTTYIVPRGGINRGSSRSCRVKARLHARILAARGGSERRVPRERTLVLPVFVCGVFTIRLRYSTSDGRAGRSNLSAAIIPDNYVKGKNSDRENGESSTRVSVENVDRFSRLPSNRCELLKIRNGEFMCFREFFLSFFF